MSRVNVYADDEDPQGSIFRPPNDEEVFVTRETEKQKRKEAKEQAQHLKLIIWNRQFLLPRTGRVDYYKDASFDYPDLQVFDPANSDTLKSRTHSVFLETEQHSCTLQDHISD